MRKRFMILLCGILLISFIITGCTEPSLSALETFHQYMEISMYQGEGEAFRKYGYCSDPNRQQEIESMTNPILDYSILEWRTISDSLYAVVYTYPITVEVNGVTKYIQFPSLMFVAQIEGMFRITPIDYLPDDLKVGIDMDEYYALRDRLSDEMWDELGEDILGPVDTYEAYYKTARTDVAEAFNAYGYCADPNLRNQLLNDTSYISIFRPLKLLPLADGLWVAETEIHSSANDFIPTTRIDFIALINNEFKVMDIDSIPYSLKKDVDLSPYQQHTEE